MGGLTKTGNFVHDSNVVVAEGIRQVAVAAAGANQSAVVTAEQTYWRSRKSSTLANNMAAEAANATVVLRMLGTSGT